MARKSTYTCDACNESVSCEDGDRLIKLNWRTCYAVGGREDLSVSDNRARDVCYSCLAKMFDAIEARRWERFPEKTIAPAQAPLCQT